MNLKDQPIISRGVGGKNRPTRLDRIYGQGTEKMYLSMKKIIPDNIVKVRIDRNTGLLTNKTDSSSMFEYFIQGTQPKEYVQDSASGNMYTTPNGSDVNCFNFG
ncbi:hypothetical protein P4S72_09625 [Vibrio sp. PP-XX7]